MAVSFLLACDTLPSNPWERDRLPAIRKALTNWKHNIIDIYEFNSRKEAHEIHLMKGCPFFDDNNLVELNRKFYERVLSYKCDILILGTIDNYSWFLLPETVADLQREGVCVVGIFGDDEFTSKYNRFYVPMFDKVVAYVQSCVDYYNSLIPGCCYYLPNSCHIPEKKFENLNNIDQKQHDVVVFGAPFGVRPLIIEALIDAGIKVSIFGSPKWEKIKKLKEFYFGYVPSEDFDSTIRQSKIILALLEDHLTGALHMNTKIWEAARNGQMCISTKYLPLIEDYGLIENEDIVMYHSVEDLVKKVDYYLKNDHERIKIANNLFQKIIKHFDYENLYKNMFCYLEQEYLNKKQNPISTAESRKPLITIIDDSKDGAAQKDFDYVKLSRSKAEMNSLRKNYKKIIKTPYVIFTKGGYTYSPYLNNIVDMFPDEFINGKAALLPMGNKSQYRNIRVTGIDTIVWKKDYFYSQYLTKKLKFFCWKKVHNYSRTKLRLCKSSNKSLILSNGLFFVWPSLFYIFKSIAKKMNIYLTALMKRLK